MPPALLLRLSIYATKEGRAIDDSPSRSDFLLYIYIVPTSSMPYTLHTARRTHTTSIYVPTPSPNCLSSLAGFIAPLSLSVRGPFPLPATTKAKRIDSQPPRPFRARQNGAPVVVGVCVGGSRVKRGWTSSRRRLVLIILIPRKQDPCLACLSLPPPFDSDTLHTYTQANKTDDQDRALTTQPKPLARPFRFFLAISQRTQASKLRRPTAPPPAPDRSQPSSHDLGPHARVRGPPEAVWRDGFARRGTCWVGCIGAEGGMSRLFV